MNDCNRQRPPLTKVCTLDVRDKFFVVYFFVIPGHVSCYTVSESVGLKKNTTSILTIETSVNDRKPNLGSRYPPWTSEMLIVDDTKGFVQKLLSLKKLCLSNEHCEQMDRVGLIIVVSKNFSSKLGSEKVWRVQ